MFNLRSYISTGCIIAVISISAHGLPSSTVCDGLKGAAWGMCKAGAAIGCDTSERDSQSCASIENNYSQVTGSDAPWLYNERVVFITSGTYMTGTPYDPVLSSNTFMSLSDADRICQDTARYAGLHGTFQAWLSTNTSSPDTRFATKSEVPYVRTDGVLVADNWIDLTSPENPDDINSRVVVPWIKNPINVDESGYSVVGYADVLSGTSADGTSYLLPEGYPGENANCSGWTVYGSYPPMSLHGSGGTTMTSWSSDETLSCIGSEAAGHFYCFQQ